MSYFHHSDDGRPRSELPTLALAGNPNSGKTTSFNALTGARQHVGNYPGITVEQKEGIAHCDGEAIRIIDLPGARKLTVESWCPPNTAGAFSGSPSSAW